MLKKLTITVDEDVYAGLRSKVGRRRISRFLNDLARPLVTEDALLEGYRQMALDGVGEDEANEWCEALIGDAIPDGD
ncbi:MAG: addiction module antitoxin [Pseudomonadota bacterium]|nr:addiction module antitoxin [Pseudomonadota bacterium]